MFDISDNDLRLALAAVFKAGRVRKDQQSGKPIVVHGFRASCPTWGRDHGYDETMIEVALAHAVGTETTRRYQRSDMVERRAGMMAAWSEQGHRANAGAAMPRHSSFQSASCAKNRLIEFHRDHRLAANVAAIQQPIVAQLVELRLAHADRTVNSLNPSCHARGSAPKTIAARLLKTIIRLNDENPGTRETAANLVRQLMRRPDFNIHDWHLTRQGTNGTKSNGAKLPDKELELFRENHSLRHELLEAQMEVGRSKCKLHEQQIEIDRLQAFNYELNAGTARQISDLQQKLAVAERRAELAVRSKATGVGPTPPPRPAKSEQKDPWHDAIAIWLDEEGDDGPIPSCVILEAISVTLTTESGRRLRRIMRQIGG